MREEDRVRLSRFVADESASFMAAALLVGECVAADFDLIGAEARLTELQDRYDDRQTPWTFLREAGFGRRSPADVVSGSRIDVLLETRTGLPITLAALVAYLAGSSGQTAEGINFPGHFLIRVGQALVDPFQLIARTEAECLASLSEDARSTNPFVVARPADILLRMFNNLKYHYVARSEFHRALDMVDCQLCVLPEQPSLFFEAGEYWLRLGSIQGARAAFERASAGGDSGVSAMAQRRLTELGDRTDTLH